MKTSVPFYVFLEHYLLTYSCLFCNFFFHLKSELLHLLLHDFWHKFWFVRVIWYLYKITIHVAHISYLNHIFHSMTRYASVVQRMYRIVNSNLYAIVLLPYLWRFQCIFLFNNIVYVFIMICKQYCWHSSTYLSQYVILFTTALFDRIIFVFCCKTCV
jgi:hypothetical protein